MGRTELKLGMHSCNMTGRACAKETRSNGHDGAAFGLPPLLLERAKLTARHLQGACQCRAPQAAPVANAALQLAAAALQATPRPLSKGQNLLVHAAQRQLGFSAA